MSRTITGTPLVLHQHADSAPKLPPVKSSSSTSRISDYFIVCEILSRLRVKSLMRFKCVCKSWKSLIEKDLYFIDLHFTRSKAVEASILVEMFTLENYARVLSAKLLLPSEDGQEGGATFEKEIPVGPHRCLDYLHMLNFVNGLICFLDRKEHSVRVYNPSTGESTPWIRSRIREEPALFSYLNFGHYDFGYDPFTKEHKVLAMWVLDSRSTNFACEVLTVGKHLNQWRRIEDAPPVSPTKLADPVHTNGSIYWQSDIYDSGVPSIVEFNVRSERFRVISLPNFIIQDVTKPYDATLKEVSGRLAVLALKTTTDDYLNDTMIKNNNNTSVKMCILYDSHDDNQDGTSITGSSSCNYRWMEESFSTPPFDWKLSWFEYMHPIQGTDLSIIQYPEDDDFSFYYYNWRRRSFLAVKVHNKWYILSRCVCQIHEGFFLFLYFH
ncbi:hypothetical protein MKW92_013680 [Papaver armeniacum]|nr:hypothetical protein MKW92_013680 [Papaver armeniacum]